MGPEQAPDPGPLAGFLQRLARKRPEPIKRLPHFGDISIGQGFCVSSV